MTKRQNKKSGRRRRRPVVLLTGFDRFGEFGDNPSELVVRELAAQPPQDILLHTMILPTQFHASGDRLRQALDQLAPDFCLCLGAIPGELLRIEQIAVNVKNSNVPDNAGEKPVDQRIIELGPPAYWSGLPVRKIAERLKRAGLPATTSYFAGTYVCNHVFYTLMHHVRANDLRTKAGFIHVPGLQSADKDAAKPMKTSELVHAVRLVLALLAKSN